MRRPRKVTYRTSRGNSIAIGASTDLRRGKLETLAWVYMSWTRAGQPDGIALPLTARQCLLASQQFERVARYLSRGSK